MATKPPPSIKGKQTKNASHSYIFLHILTDNFKVMVWTKNCSLACNQLPVLAGQTSSLAGDRRFSPGLHAKVTVFTGSDAKALDGPGIKWHLQRSSRSTNGKSILYNVAGKRCHKPPFWEWFVEHRKKNWWWLGDAQHISFSYPTLSDFRSYKPPFIVEFPAWHVWVEIHEDQWMACKGSNRFT